MNRRARRYAGLLRVLGRFCVATLLVICCCGWSESEKRVSLVPRLHAGQTLRYESRAQISRKVKTESRIVNLAEPKQEQRDIGILVNLKILAISGRSESPVVTAEAEVAPQTNGSQDAKAEGAAGAAKKVTLQFTILESGQIVKMTGAQELDAEQQLLWEFWLAQFAYGWTLPAN